MHTLKWIVYVWHVYMRETITTMKVAKTTITPKESSCPTVIPVPTACSPTPQAASSWLCRSFVFSRVLYKWNHRVCTLFFCFAMAISLQIIILRFTYVAIHAIVLFFFLMRHIQLNTTPQLKYTFTPNGHFVCLRFLVITNKAAMNIHIQFFVWT